MAKIVTKTVKIKLDTLLRMKENLESDIKKSEYLMRKNNSRPKSEEPQIDFSEVKRLYELKLTQLIEIKLAIADANIDANNENIYRLSNLNRRKAFLNSLNTFEGRRTTLKSAGKEIEFEAKLNWKKVEEELKIIEESIRKIETELSEFNHATETSVKMYSELKLV